MKEWCRAANCVFCAQAVERRVNEPHEGETMAEGSLWGGGKERLAVSQLWFEQSDPASRSATLGRVAVVARPLPPLDLVGDALDKTDHLYQKRFGNGGRFC